MIKYLNWKWYDWCLLPIILLWTLIVTMIMSPAMMVEYMIFMGARTIRENRFYERHDFGEVEDLSELDGMDMQAINEQEEQHVIGNFIYKSKVFRIMATLITFRKTGELR